MTNAFHGSWEAQQRPTQEIKPEIGGDDFIKELIKDAAGTKCDVASL